MPEASQIGSSSEKQAPSARQVSEAIMTPNTDALKIYVVEAKKTRQARRDNAHTIIACSPLSFQGAAHQILQRIAVGEK